MISGKRTLNQAQTLSNFNYTSGRISKGFGGRTYFLLLLNSPWLLFAQHHRQSGKQPIAREGAYLSALDHS